MRKYKKGALINSLEELMQQDFIYFYDKVYHKGWFRGWQIGWVKSQIKYKCFRKACKNDTANIWIDEFNKISPNSQFMERTK